MDASCDHNHHTDEARELVRTDISRYGCHVIYVMPTPYLPGFAYTIGLYENYKAPEIICFGLNNDLLGEILNDACSMVRSGQKFIIEHEYDSFLEGYNVQFLTVDKAFYENYFGYCIWYKGGNDFPAVQLIWPDKQQKFPWDEDFNPDWKFKQPLLDRNVDFKFYEEKNTTVFVTKNVLEGAPILYVYHDKDGEWQFHSESSTDIKDARIIAFSQITKIDSSVNDLFGLELGWCAWRLSIGED